jgi:hypothetical protein
MTQKGRVSPFGDPRIKGCSPLPAAFRSVPRPSSPLSAKASTKCPYALDPKLFRRTQRADPLCNDMRASTLTQHFMLPAWPPASGPATPGSPRASGNRCLRPVAFLSTMSNSKRPRRPNQILVPWNGKPHSQRFPYGPAVQRAGAKPAWWSRPGSNRRPPACKAGALPAELRPRFPSADLVGQGRLELPTSRLSSARSNQLSY